jgi:NADH-quinone oxidoreductase subunit L
MTAPLVILSIFAIGYGWVGIPENFMNLDRLGIHLPPNWFHEFVGGTLAEHPPVLPFSWVPLTTSLLVALGGLTLGWLVYRNVEKPEQDKLQIPVLKNKWYFDEIYNYAFVKPAYWIAETVIYKWMDQGVIDGILHTFGKVTGWMGDKIRNWIDLPVINGFGDMMGYGTKDVGKAMRPMQSGRIQQYMLVAMLTLIIVGAILYYFLTPA